MFKQIGLTKKIFVLGSLILLFAGCEGGVGSSSYGLSAVAADSGAVAGSSDGIADKTQMYVGVDVAVNDVAHVHADGPGNFGTKCAISPSTSMNDVSCIVDIPEGELFYHGLSFVYNVPKGMCRFLKRKTYWYYNEEVGVGASSVAISRTFSGSPAVISAYSCTIGTTGPSMAACTSDPEVTVNVGATNPEVNCVYDHSDVGGGNGCFGSYVKSITTRTITASSDVTTVDSKNVSWGGTVGSVLGGAGRYGWDVSADGTPLALVTPASLGIEKASYKIAAPIDSINSMTTMELANYYKPGIHNHSGFYDTRVSTKPYFIDPVDDRNGTPIGPTSPILQSGNDSYEFECLDGAFEVKQRIRVYVREWDTYQDFSDFVTSAGQTSVPDRSTGNEGPVGSPTCEGIEGPCNDFYDSDDFLNLFVGGTYGTALPQVPLRSTYFPLVNHK